MTFLSPLNNNGVCLMGHCNQLSRGPKLVLEHANISFFLSFLCVCVCVCFVLLPCTCCWEEKLEVQMRRISCNNNMMMQQPPGLPLLLLTLSSTACMYVSLCMQYGMHVCIYYLPNCYQLLKRAIEGITCIDGACRSTKGACNLHRPMWIKEALK